uniref:Uncharacterized protein n=1 Tax=Macrostomum lignano TaxID=282301 RepID=A0A1I8HZ24_9PLAT
MGPAGCVAGQAAAAAAEATSSDRP